MTRTGWQREQDLVSTGHKMREVKINMDNRDKTGRRCPVRGVHKQGNTTRQSQSKIEIYQLDAFTDVPFGGNPAGVVPHAEGLSDEHMQKIAREMNLSETAFVTDLRQAKQAPGDPDFLVRFFTPQSEVDLCGHATIATFWLLAELGVISPGHGAGEAEEEIRVYQKTGAGGLPVDLLFGCEGGPARVMMTQALPQVAFTLDEPEIKQLERILRAPQGSITGFPGPKPQSVSTGLLDLIVPVTSMEALFSMRPDMAALAQYCREREVISVHCFSMDTVDAAATVHCRDFAPAVGIPEEAATGTASGATGAYLVLNQLVDTKQPVTRIICEQGHVMKRPSVIHVEIGMEGREITSVRVGGSAVTVMKGWMYLP